MTDWDDVDAEQEHVDAKHVDAEKEHATAEVRPKVPEIVERIGAPTRGVFTTPAPRRAYLVEQVVRAVPIPVTVKMRLGWDDQNITAPAFARAFEQVGVAAIAIHGRTRAQGFSGVVNRDGIRQVVEAVESIPVIGNGDVRTVADAERMLRETGCDGVSIGRGALANPWIFRQLEQWERTGQYEPAGDFDDRLRLLKQQFRYVMELRGGDRAVPFFRKMAHWYLKSMRVPPILRNKCQQVHTCDEFFAVIDEIAERGPAVGTRHDLPDMHIHVPAGPNANW